ncbi:hypothetical protein BH11PAT4_BH11PAT4_6660 [soil metagenome]
MEFPFKVSTDIPTILTHSSVYARPMIHLSRVLDAVFEIHTVAASFISRTLYENHFGKRILLPYDSEQLFTPVMDRFSDENLPALRYMSDASCCWMASEVRDNPDLICIIHCYALTKQLLKVAGGHNEATEIMDVGTVALLKKIGPKPILQVRHPTGLNGLCEKTRYLSSTAAENLS